MENLCREDGRQRSQKDLLRDGEMKLHWAAWAASHGRLAPFHPLRVRGDASIFGSLYFDVPTFSAWKSQCLVYNTIEQLLTKLPGS